MDCTKRGIVVTNGFELSLVSKVKENQDKDPIFLELKATVHNNGHDELIKFWYVLKCYDMGAG